MKRILQFLAAALVAATSTSASAQQRIDRPGTVAHRAAAASFPERVGEFRRTGVHQYDREGLDVSAGYALATPDGQVALTVYIYPSARVAAAFNSDGRDPADQARLCGREFEGVEQAIVGRFAGAERTAEGGAPPVDGVDSALTRRSLFRLEAEWNGKRQPLRSEAGLYCFVGGLWQVKYRVTGPAGIDTGEAVEQFIRTGPWPGRQPMLEPDEITALDTASGGVG